MNRAILLAALLTLPLAATTANAEPMWLPVCHDKDVRVGPYVWVHVGIDCSREAFVQVCPPGQECRRITISLV